MICVVKFGISRPKNAYIGRKASRGGPGDAMAIPSIDELATV